MESDSEQGALIASAGPTSLSFENAPNFRDLGGYEAASGLRVRAGVLFRSDQLNRLMPAELDTLSSAGVRMIVDLRRGVERDVEATPELPNVQQRVADVLVDANIDLDGLPEGSWARVAAGGGADVMCDLYRGLVSLPGAQRAYAALLESVLAADGATVFHCMAGQDRTGWAAAVILTALGVRRELVLHDYLLSVRRLKVKHSRILAEDVVRLARYAVTEAELLPLYWVRTEYLDAAFRQVDKQFGSFENYLRTALNLDTHLLQMLRIRLLR
jgi:protein-tyrosine phosphatase